MQSPSVPRLALPFLLVGASGGWLSAVFLANPFIGIIEGGWHRLAAVSGAATAALLGAALPHLCAPSANESSPFAAWPRMVAALAAGGFFTGSLIATAGGGSPAMIVSGAALGALCAAAFFPVCALVLTAALRAGRARYGSLVASSDRRAVWGILATALAVTSVGAIIEWPFALAHLDRARDAAQVAITLLAACGLVIALVLAADIVALARLRSAVAAIGLEAREPHAVSARQDVRCLDLGLGDDVHAELARGAAVYRQRDRAVALVVGNAAWARTILRRAVARGAFGLTVVAITAAGHALVARYSPLMCPSDAVIIVKTASLEALLERAILFGRI